MENKDTKEKILNDSKVSNLTIHESYIWNHLINSIPDNLNDMPHYFSPLTNYEKNIDFNEKFNLRKLEIPLHIYLKNNTIINPVLDELNNIIEENDIILRPLNDDDALNFKKINGIQIQDDNETAWEYYLNYSMQDFNVEPGFAALLFTYKGFSMAAISIHPGGNIDVRGPYMMSKLYVLKYGNILNYSSLKGFIHGTSIVLDSYQINSKFFFNESCNVWQHKKNNLLLDIQISNLPSNIDFDYDEIPEILK